LRGIIQSYHFTFQFFPKSFREAEEVRKIIKDFQNGSTPRRVESAIGGEDKLVTPYFASPRQWTIKFIASKPGGGPQAQQQGMQAGENPYLPKIQRSVISSFMINHDPDSVISFHRDGSPVHSTLTLTFKEIVHVTSEDEVSEQFQADVDEVGTTQRSRIALFTSSGSDNETTTEN